MTTYRSAVWPILLVAVLAFMSTVVQSGGEVAFDSFRFIDGHSNLMTDAMNELDQEMMMESESSRRLLAGHSGYISYGAMGRNRVPCSQRGYSYYNCNSHQKANPYTRGCTRATHCARSNH